MHTALNNLLIFRGDFMKKIFHVLYQIGVCVFSIVFIIQLGINGIVDTIYSFSHKNGVAAAKYLEKYRIKALSSATKKTPLHFYPNENDKFDLIAEGEIEKNSARDLEDILKTQNFYSVSFNSSGGSITEAIKIGNLIKTYNLSTIVHKKCVSSCILSFLGGIIRKKYSSGPDLILENFYSNESLKDHDTSMNDLSNSDKIKVVRSQIIIYLNSLKIDTALIDFIDNIPSKEKHILTSEELSKFKILHQYDEIDLLIKKTPEDSMHRSSQFLDAVSYDSNSEIKIVSLDQFNAGLVKIFQGDYVFHHILSVNGRLIYQAEDKFIKPVGKVFRKSIIDMMFFTVQSAATCCTGYKQLYLVRSIKDIGFGIEDIGIIHSGLDDDTADDYRFIASENQILIDLDKWDKQHNFTTVSVEGGIQNFSKKIDSNYMSESDCDWLWDESNNCVNKDGSDIIDCLHSANVTRKNYTALVNKNPGLRESALIELVKNAYENKKPLAINSFYLKVCGIKK